MKLYVVVCEDRHVDDDITVWSTLELANAAVEAFVAGYDEDDVWQENPGLGAPKWVRYVDSGDEGPKARIEVTELDREPSP